MIQEIITYIILIIAAAITINNFIRFFKRSDQPCAGCRHAAECKIGGLKSSTAKVQIKNRST